LEAVASAKDGDRAAKREQEKRQRRLEKEDDRKVVPEAVTADVAKHKGVASLRVVGVDDQRAVPERRRRQRHVGHETVRRQVGRRCARVTEEWRGRGEDRGGE